jgi:hypothetical protein
VVGAVGIKGFDIYKIVPNVQGATGLLVRTWSLVNPDPQNPAFPYQLGTTATDQGGVWGQNNQNPPGQFENHFVTRLAIGIAPGPDGVLNSTRAGDDEMVGNTIYVGQDEICQSIVAGDDMQVIAVGQKGKIYDPSYGQEDPFATEVQWEDGSLDGFFGQGNRARKNTPNLQEVTFTKTTL